MKIQKYIPERIAHFGIALALGVLTLSACAPAEPEPTTDVRAEAVAILEGSLSSGSPGSTEAEREEALDLAIETLELTCADPDATVSIEAYELSEGAQSVLANNGIVACEVFQ